MSAGLYVLQPGEADRQGPHREDELYYVVGGKATLRVGDEDRPQVLVVFAPAETVPTTA